MDECARYSMRHFRYMTFDLFGFQFVGEPTQVFYRSHVFFSCLQLLLPSLVLSFTPSKKRVVSVSIVLPREYIHYPLSLLRSCSVFSHVRERLVRQVYWYWMRVALNHSMCDTVGTGRDGMGEWMDEWMSKREKEEREKSQSNHHLTAAPFSQCIWNLDRKIFIRFLCVSVSCQWCIYILSVCLCITMCMCGCVAVCLCVRPCVHFISFAPPPSIPYICICVYRMLYAPRIHFLYPTSITLITHIFSLGSY